MKNLSQIMKEKKGIEIERERDLDICDERERA